MRRKNKQLEEAQKELDALNSAKAHIDKRIQEEEDGMNKAQYGMDYSLYDSHRKVFIGLKQGLQRVLAQITVQESLISSIRVIRAKRFTSA